MIRLFGHRPPAVALAFFSGAYALTGGWAQGLALIPDVSIIFWPPAGIFLAALLLTPRSMWPWWVAAGCVAELAGNAIWFHNPIAYALVYFAANALEALAAAWLILRIAPQPFRLESFREVAAFVVFGAGVAPVIGATCIALTDAFRGKHPFAVAWPLVWLGDATGLLVSTPLALVAAQAWRNRLRIPRQRFVEAAAIVAALVVTGVLAFRGLLPTVYMTLPALLWAAVRFQLKGAAASLALVTVMTALATARGAGEFAGEPELIHEKLIMLQSFLGISAVSAVVVAALSKQHQHALRKLALVNRELEIRVSERTEGLRESEERLRLARNAADFGIHDYDVATGRIHWDDRVREIWGVEPNEPVTYTQFAASLHADDRASVEASVARALDPKGDGSYSAEYRIVNRRDGSTRWVAATGRTTFDGDSPVRLVGVVQEITARKAAEQALRDSQTFTSQITEVAPCVLYVYDLELDRNVWGNREMSAILGYSSEQIDAMAGKLLPTLLHPEDMARYAAHAARLASLAPGESADFEYRMRHADGAWRWLYSCEMPFRRNAADGLTQVIGAAIDVTDRKHAEQLLRDVDRRKDEFLAVLAHELRNPLAPLRNAVQIIQAIAPDNPEVQWSAEVIDRQVGAMTRLIDELMDVSRINQGKVNLLRQHVDVAHIMSVAIETSRPLIESMGHQLTVVLPAHPAIIDADPARIAQVLVNLLNNAAKYTEPGGRIALRAVEKHDVLELSISDSGVGIPAEQLRDVFELFSQVDSSRSRSQGGLGIGLSLVKRLVEMHGGRITAHSDGAGCGSEFVICFPLADDLARTPNNMLSLDKAEAM